VRIKEHSDYANTDTPEQATEHGRRMAWIPLDAEGYACAGGWHWCAQGDESATSHQWLKQNRGQPLDPADVVWPEDGWPVDGDGRGRSVLEVKGAEALVREQHVLVQHIRQYLRRPYDTPNEVAA
jgi:hypothetical protein